MNCFLVSQRRPSACDCSRGETAWLLCRGLYQTLARLTISGIFVPQEAVQSTQRVLSALEEDFPTVHSSSRGISSKESSGEEFSLTKVHRSTQTPAGLSKPNNMDILNLPIQYMTAAPHWYASVRPCVCASCCVWQPSTQGISR